MVLVLKGSEDLSLLCDLILHLRKHFVILLEKYWELLSELFGVDSKVSHEIHGIS